MGLFDLFKKKKTAAGEPGEMPEGEASLPQAEAGAPAQAAGRREKPHHEVMPDDVLVPVQAEPVGRDDVAQDAFEPENEWADEAEAAWGAEPEPDAAAPDMPAAKPKVGFFERLKGGLAKTRSAITTRIDQMLAGFGKVDEDLFEELEEILITSDVGMETSLKIVASLRERVKRDRIADVEGVRRAIREEIAGILASEAGDLRLASKPAVIVVIGVNGVGKTTSIGKIAHLLKSQGKKVVVAAADTFRAAAIDQLEIWTTRAGVPIVKHEEGSDPAAVIFDAIQAVKARGADVLIVDTAGRLHTKKNLMEELRKIFRIIGRELPDADIESLLVLDATTGQNAVSQAKVFSEVGNLTGLILTKLDGTAKGGIVISIMSELNVPVKFIGVGEQMDDLQPFDADSFAEALFGKQEG